MIRTLLSGVWPGRSRDLRYYTRLIGTIFADPGALCLYALAGWSLTANLGLTHSSPWSEGPLSNWMVWLALALLLTLVSLKLHEEGRY